MDGGVPAASAAQKNQFDLSNQADVLALLNFVRRSTLDPDLQNDTRNLILDYTSNPSTEFLNEIQSVMQSVGVSVGVGIKQSATPVTNQAETTKPLGNARPKPSFLPVSVKESKEGKEEKVQVSVTKETSPTVPTAEPAMPTQTAEPESAEPKVTTDTAAASQPAQPASLPQTEPAPAAPVQEEVAKEELSKPAVDESQSQNYNARIKEIKHVVNEKVGNPVNLIDINNAVGREYMNALLAAIKQSSGGSAEEAKAAMERLETAYQAVEGVLAGRDTEAHAEPAPSAEPAATPATPEPAEERPPESVSEVTKPKLRIIKDEVPPVAPPDNQPAPAESAPAPVAAPEPAAVVPPAPVVEETPSPESELEPVPASGGLRSLGDDLEAAPHTPTQSAPAATPALSSMPAPTASLSPEDPLQSGKITSGLDQLLSEWSLFKSSGIFGTGPSGREHPLYKKLANLSMAAVISGRFEGSTPEIKQSIADYMNGWRYEQGVVHTMEETFEHYLRRVIKTILEKQGKPV